MFAVLSRVTRLLNPPRLGEGGTTAPPRNWAAMVVWGAWFGLTAWVLWFVIKHGRNIPVTDEWAFISTYYGGFREKLSWLFERHCEHRFILGRALFLGLLWVTGLDFRAGMWATVVFLAAASAVLILAARKLRGRTHPADLVFPVLLLHLGHTENLMMGYQLVFTLTVLHLALFALLAAHSEAMRPATAALLGSLLLVPIALGGGQGLSFVPALGCWVAWQAARGLRTESKWRTVLAGGIALAVASYTAWAAYEQMGHAPKGVTRNSLPDTVRIATQVVGMGVGPMGISETPAIGVALLVAELATALALLVIAVRNPQERPVAAGLLVLLGGSFAFALAIGHARDSGWVSRFAAFAAMGPAVVLLTLARYRGAATRPVLTVGLCAAGAAITGLNAYHGNCYAALLDHVHHSFKADVKAGLPIDVLAQRNVCMWDFTVKGWRTLWEHGFPPLAGVPGPYQGTPVPTAFVPDEYPDPHPALHRKCYRFDLPAEHSLLGIRVAIQSEVRSSWETFHLEWNDPRTGELKRSSVTAWVHPNRNEATMFIVRGPIKSGRIFLGREACPIRVVSAELLPQLPPGN